MKAFSRSMLKMETFFEYIERKPEMPPSGDEKPEKLQGEIEFRNVCFTYPSRPTKVLKVQYNSKGHGPKFGWNLLS